MNRILSIFLAGVVVAQAGLRGDHKVAKHAKHTKLNLLQRQDPSDDEAPYGSFMNTEESDSGDMPDATVESHFDQFADAGEGPREVADDFAGADTDDTGVQDDNGGVISHTFDDARSGHLDDD